VDTGHFTRLTASLLFVAFACTGIHAEQHGSSTFTNPLLPSGPGSMG
jgi:hypothetical protein